MQFPLLLKTGIVKDERYFNHQPGEWHPESPERLKAIYRRLEMSEINGAYQQIAPRFALEEEICFIHTSAYVHSIAATAGMEVTLDADTVTSPLSYETACLAVGGSLNLIKAICQGEINNGFALIRPPGHHAEKDRAMGFCFFNNIAITAAYALAEKWAKRILIVDWDVHHGNGTQHAFYSSADVLYFSIHQYPHYPMTGQLEETGEGKGKGLTVNVPLQAGYGDQDYIYIFSELLLPIASQFKPDLILVSAGFDPYVDDPLGGMRITVSGFAALAFILRELAAKFCNHRLGLFLEGGYHLEGIARAVEAIIKVLLGEKIGLPDLSQYQPSKEIEYIFNWHWTIWRF
ncbi:MAG: histone deacetylase [Candidatus Desulfofervidaceae bacterium]|nr:histone deacetylase [Candidatus Desulfofervidaceae bacterium]